MKFTLTTTVEISDDELTEYYHEFADDLYSPSALKQIATGLEINGRDALVNGRFFQYMEARVGKVNVTVWRGTKAGA